MCALMRWLAVVDRENIMFSSLITGVGEGPRFGYLPCPVRIASSLVYGF